MTAYIVVALVSFNLGIVFLAVWQTARAWGGES